MLFLLIATAWLAVVLFAATMCRLAARSDDSRAVALAERIATSYKAAPEGARTNGSTARPSFGLRRGARGMTLGGRGS